MLISIMVRNKIHAIKLTTQENTIKLKIYSNDFSYFRVCGFGLDFQRFSVHTQYFMITKNLWVKNEPVNLESHEMKRYDKYFSGK